MSLSSNTKSKITDKINVYSSLVYVGVVSSIMFFAGLSSAVLVRVTTLLLVVVAWMFWWVEVAKTFLRSMRL